MKTIIRKATILLVFCMISTISLSQVRADYKEDTDFTKYKSYTFKGWEKDSDQQLNDFDKERITDAFKHELEIRGFIYDSSNPDVGITLFVVVDERTSQTAYTNYTSGFGYGRSWGWGPGMGTATTTYSERDYTVGTVVIDFYDEESKDLVFQGTMQTEEAKKAKQREKTKPKNITTLKKKQ